MKAAASIANSAWVAASLPAWRRFRAAVRDPAAAQRRRLLACVRRNADTAFGREHGFGSIRTIEEYRDRVPIRGYDELEPWVTRIARGESFVLTAESVTRLVPSSGSTSAVKLIPFTRSLHRELAAGVGAWIADLYRRAPTLLGGPAYWSVTPVAGDSRPFVDADSVEASVVPIGFDDDAAYLGVVRAALARRAVAVPPDVRLERDLDAFRHATLVHLLLARDLRLVSVWHPSLFAGLLDALREHWPRLVDEVGRRRRERAAELRRADPLDVRSIWPRLAVVSCWAHGPSAAPAADLARRLGNVSVQPKGLLATEGVVSIPIGDRHPVAVTSHVVEFLDGAGRPRLAHELDDGGEYVVVLTTGGGLYRYRLADRVRVSGFVEATPSLEFIGRDDRVSDRCGEKLSDGFVAGAIDRLFRSRVARQPRFALLAADAAEPGGRMAYTLFVESDDGLPDDLASGLERELRRNPHYAWCVDLGQLRPARVMRVGPGAHAAYVERCRADGQRLGDIKPVSLHPADGWRNALVRPMRQRDRDAR